MTYSWRRSGWQAPKRAMLNKLIQKASDYIELGLDASETVSVMFVGPRVMARVNEEFVGHSGVTDVITFHYREDPFYSPDTDELAIELFICVDVAKQEGDARDDSSYAKELVLYVVHGLLHCAGYDDLTDDARPKMRKAEQDVLGYLEKEFKFTEIFQEKK